MDNNTLYLTIRRIWFDKILSGEKQIEYRNVTPFFDRKFSKQYNSILLQAGYSKDSPRLTEDIIKIEKQVVNILDIFKTEQEFYCIHLSNPKRIR